MRNIAFTDHVSPVKGCRTAYVDWRAGTTKSTTLCQRWLYPPSQELWIWLQVASKRQLAYITIFVFGIRYAPLLNLLFFRVLTYFSSYFLADPAAWMRPALLQPALVGSLRPPPPSPPLGARTSKEYRTEKHNSDLFTRLLPPLPWDLGLPKSIVVSIHPQPPLPSRTYEEAQTLCLTVKQKIISVKFSLRFRISNMSSPPPALSQLQFLALSHASPLSCQVATQVYHDGTNIGKIYISRLERFVTDHNS